MSFTRLSVTLSSCALIAAASVAEGASVSLNPSHDGTLYQSAVSELANGVGEFLFSGETSNEELRRAVLAFDVASAIPAGATITSATLTLTLNKTIAGDESTTLHRLTASWGEGDSNAPGNEGGGTTPAAGDATWTYRSWNTDQWTTPGGDYAAMPSAAEIIGSDLKGYDFGSTAEMVADVQGWLDSPATNHGWIVIGDEGSLGTAKRFGSREGAMAERPVLTIEYRPVPEPASAMLAVALIGVWRACRLRRA